MIVSHGGVNRILIAWALQMPTRHLSLGAGLCGNESDIVHRPNSLRAILKPLRV